MAENRSSILMMAQFFRRQFSLVDIMLNFRIGTWFKLMLQKVKWIQGKDPVYPYVDIHTLYIITSLWYKQIHSLHKFITLTT